MIAAWMMYATVVAALMSLAALALERAAGVVGRSRRWAWAAALAASVALPVFALTGLDPAGGGSGLLPSRADVAVRAVLEPLVAARAAVGGGPAQGVGGIDLVLAGGWLLASGVLALLYLRGGRTLARGRRDWEQVTATSLGFEAGETPLRPDIPVLLTDRLGPAVVGFRRGEILLPRWCLELSPDERALIVAHEVEHVEAGDARLLLAARFALVCLPWSLPLWWQAHRLRLAVEIDCDHRVLRRDVPAARYGELLLEVGRRRGTGRPAHAVAALAEPVSNLERRIRAMTESTPRPRWLHALLAATAALALMAVACESPTPVDGTAEDGTAEEVAGDAAESTVPARPDAPDVADGAPTEPGYVPRDEEPRLLNGEELSGALQRGVVDRGPDGPTGSATVMAFVDAEGSVTETRIDESSGHEELDAAAKEVVKRARFEPAKKGDETIGVWVLQKVEFRSSV